MLRSYAIIPEELYVERAADRQLDDVLREMGRPGYVLVARQMGKTNLLLHAKRRYERQGDVFAYVDVSNLFPELRAFLRNIVDVCIDTSPEMFSAAASTIASSRAASSPLPHKEHEIELRLLLRASAGRIVICLDEIDALTNTSYSDSVFSLVRSIYFSGRANFPEFRRLTYVLSGVAEPSEIIKNKAISPFNIGAKIYLSDFTRSEVGVFVKQAGLGFQEAVVDRIFYWANGNPRMIWDICMSIETSKVASVDMVDATVEELYLKSFDIPPVDHIRVLAESDAEIRRALVSVHRGQDQDVSAAIRNRLYLAGITQQNAAAGVLKIKNRVLEIALSESWLSELGSLPESALERALSHFDAGQFSKSLAAYEEHLSSGGEINDPVLFFFGMGSCQYFLGEFRAAIDAFARAPAGPAFASIYLAERTRLGISLLITDRLEESIAMLESAVQFGRDHQEYMSHPLYFEACANLSAALMARGRPNDSKASLALSRLVIETVLSGAKFKTDEALSTILVSAFYTAFRASLTVERNSAEAYLNQAIAEANDGRTVTLLLERAMLIDRGEKRFATLRECVELCVALRVPISARSASAPLAFSDNQAVRLMQVLGDAHPVLDAELQKFLLHMADSSIAHAESVYTIGMSAFMGSLPAKREDTVSRILARMLELPRSNSTDNDRRGLAALVAMVGVGAVNASVETTLLDDYLGGETIELKEHELVALYTMLNRQIALGNQVKALEIARVTSMAARQGSESGADQSFTMLMAEYMDIAVRRLVDPGSVKGGRVVDLHKSLREFKGANVAPHQVVKDMMIRLAAFAPSLLAGGRVPYPLPKIGRNKIVTVEFKGGRIERGKYKKFEESIRSGEAKLK